MQHKGIAIAPQTGIILQGKGQTRAHVPNIQQAIDEKDLGLLAVLLPSSFSPKLLPFHNGNSTFV